MLRRGLVSTAVAIAVVGALPAIAAGAGDLRSPDARDAAEHRGLYTLDETPLQDLRSPDARDAARDLPPAGATTVTVRVPVERRERVRLERRGHRRRRDARPDEHRRRGRSCS